MSAMDDQISQEEMDRQFQLWRTDPQKFWELTNERVERHPDSANAYFGRHQAWERLGRLDLALDDLDKALALEDHFVTWRAKGGVLHAMGRYSEAIAALDRSEQMKPDEWPQALGPLIRADCHARLGNLAAALADCATLPDDHWTPGVFGLPAGDKQEIAKELRRRAADARNPD
jgi:tetratricopeptide (TPR) repeat protein